MNLFDIDSDFAVLENGMLVLSGFDDGAAAGGTNRLLLETGDALLLEDGNGVELES